ncbi:hypothetical protein ON010_g9566 [Phytophthora cinnamomi]|nr:hypothetical protein ON010_g9566 [Phytophthora cinnamomi]
MSTLSEYEEPPPMAETAKLARTPADDLLTNESVIEVVAVALDKIMETIEARVDAAVVKMARVPIVVTVAVAVGIANAVVAVVACLENARSSYAAIFLVQIVAVVRWRCIGGNQGGGQSTRNIPVRRLECLSHEFAREESGQKVDRRMSRDGNTTACNVEADSQRSPISIPPDLPRTTPGASTTSSTIPFTQCPRSPHYASLQASCTGSAQKATLAGGSYTVGGAVYKTAMNAASITDTAVPSIGSIPLAPAAFLLNRSIARKFENAIGAATTAIGHAASKKPKLNSGVTRGAACEEKTSRCALRAFGSGIAFPSSQQQPSQPSQVVSTRPGTMARGPKKADGDHTRKPRKKKDKNAPKRALSAFMFYSNDIRETVKKERPDLAFLEISSEIGRRWKQISDEERRVRAR